MLRYTAYMEAQIERLGIPCYAQDLMKERSYKLPVALQAGARQTRPVEASAELDPAEAGNTMLAEVADSRSVVRLKYTAVLEEVVL